MICLCFPVFYNARALNEVVPAALFYISMPISHQGQLCISFVFNELQQILRLASWHLGQ
jgi:hypothetical protein